MLLMLHDRYYLCCLSAGHSNVKTRWDGEGGGREAHEKWGMGIPMADSC